VPGILQDVVNYYTTTAIKPQPQFAVQAAIAFGSVAMGRRWVTDQRNFSSLYFLNIGETGSGKEHTKTVLEDLLEQSGLDDLIGPAGYTSGIRCHLSPDQKPVHVSVIDEPGPSTQSSSSQGYATQGRRNYIHHGGLWTPRRHPASGWIRNKHHEILRSRKAGEGH
jgi:hypothetical protein